MKPRIRAVAGLGLVGLALLGMEQPGLVAALLLLAGLASLALAIPARRRAARETAAPATGPTGIARILVPVDFSPQSAFALEYARAMAAPFKSQVFVLYVVPASFGLFGRHAPDAAREDRRKARTAMEAFLRACGVSGGCQVLFGSGTPFAAILEEATRLRADLIVLGRRGSGGAQTPIVGRTASEVVRRASIPVLTVGAVGPADEAAMVPAA